jgi:hypothetical protein
VEVRPVERRIVRRRRVLGIQWLECVQCLVQRKRCGIDGRETRLRRQWAESGRRKRSMGDGERGEEGREIENRLALRGLRKVREEVRVPGRRGALYSGG